MVLGTHDLRHCEFRKATPLEVSLEEEDCIWTNELELEFLKSLNPSPITELFNHFDLIVEAESFGRGLEWIRTCVDFRVGKNEEIFEKYKL